MHPSPPPPPPGSGWRSSHSAARPLTIVSHPCIPTPKRAGGWHVAHYVICPLDQSTGGAHFFPARGKKTRRGEGIEGGSETGRESRARGGGGWGGAAEEGKRIPIHRRWWRRRWPWRGGRRGCRKRARGSALPPEPRCGPIAIRKEAFFMGAARSAGLCDKN